MFLRAQTKPDVYAVMFQVLDKALSAKSKGLFKLARGGAYLLPHVYTCLIDDAPEAKIDQAINLADDLQNELSKHGIYQNVTVRPFPLRVEVDRAKPLPIPLGKYWQRMLTMSKDDGGFSPAVMYRGKTEVLLDVAFSRQANTHVGIFGTTGSGKTVMAQAVLLTLAYRNSPNAMGLVICDKTGKNFKEFAGLPHLMLPTATTKEQCETSVKAVRLEMERRQANGDDSGHRIVLVVDEFTNLLDESDSIADDIQAIAQVGRNHNVNLLLIGQKMSVSVPTIISNNIGCRIVGRIADPADAKRTAGQQSRAHRLPAGRGAFEFNNGITSTRVQGLIATREEQAQMIGDIDQRWLGMAATKLTAPVGESVSNEVAPKKFDPIFVQRIRESGETKPGAVRRIYQEMFGKQLAHYDALAVINSLGN